MHAVSQPSPPPSRYSEDVKEILGIAGKIAKKAKRPQWDDADVFQALLWSHRPFNRLDALLKALGVSAKTLHRELVQARKQAPEAAPPEASDLALPENAAEVLEVEHLLEALTQSPHPLLTPIFQKHGITPAAVQAALPKVRTGRLQRAVLFFLRETVEVVVVVLFFLIVIKEGLGELRLIPSESMVPTLQVEDRVLIEKVTPWWRPYQRGDVLVFYPPSTILRQDPLSVVLRMTGFSGFIYQKEDAIDVAYIKRLIGLPGDTIQVVPQVGVFVNGRKLTEPYVNEVADSCTLMRPNEVCGPVVVPAGHFYMMGDNRNQSADSRYWGFEPRERVVGRAVFRVWPFTRLGGLQADQEKGSLP